MKAAPRLQMTILIANNPHEHSRVRIVAGEGRRDIFEYRLECRQLKGRHSAHAPECLGLTSVLRNLVSRLEIQFLTLHIAIL